MVDPDGYTQAELLRIMAVDKNRFLQGKLVDKPAKRQVQPLAQIYPTFGDYAGAMMRALFDALILGGSAGMRAELAIWLPMYVRWQREQEYK